MESEHRELGSAIRRSARRFASSCMLARRTELWRSAYAGTTDWDRLRESLYKDDIDADGLSHNAGALTLFAIGSRQPR
jgi:uncharacterized protein YfiM (DUF2279 family)